MKRLAGKASNRKVVSLSYTGEQKFMPKKPLTIEEQIQFLKKRNVSFNLMNEDEASHFLRENTYFFKIKAYLHNYKIPTQSNACNSRYIPSDFAYLKELSTLDLALSRLALSLSNNVEHAMKIHFNNLLMSAQDYKLAENYLKKTISKLKPQINPYTSSIHQNNASSYCIWELWEILAFRDQIELYLGYRKEQEDQNPRGNKQDLKRERSILTSVRYMRNAAAHGNCLLADMDQDLPSIKRKNHSNIAVTQAALKMCRVKRAKHNRANNLQMRLNKLVVSDFASVLVSHKRYVKSKPVIRHTVDRLQEFIDRIARHQQEYFGLRQGSNEYRNKTVCLTLDAIVELCNGYINSKPI